MNTRARTTLVSLAVLAAGAGTALAPSAAHAEEIVCPPAEELQVALDGAATDAAAAKRAFKASQRPLGQLVKAHRHESRDAVKDLQRSLRGLRAEVRAAEGDAQVAARAALAAARAELREHRTLLSSKRAMLAEVKADRTESRLAWAEARSTLRDLRSLAEECAADEEPATEPPADGTSD
jgi:chromosome segregation ATPase